MLYNILGTTSIGLLNEKIRILNVFYSQQRQEFKVKNKMCIGDVLRNDKFAMKLKKHENIVKSEVIENS